MVYSVEMIFVTVSFTVESDAEHHLGYVLS